MTLSKCILKQLQAIDGTAQYSGALPKIKSSTGKVYFVKTGSSKDREQFAGEAASLKAIDAAAPGIAPRLISCGDLDDGNPYFISEYMDVAPLSSKAAEILGKRLATELHMGKSLKGFGFDIPTYCGITRLQNGWYDTWENCFAAMLQDLLWQLRSKGKYEGLCRKADRVLQSAVPKLLGPLVIQPVLLHGDLWSGNASVNSANGQPFIYDPASYYGHNEADIARMFGGFPESFFTSYHEHHAKSEPVEQYAQRGELYQLFHYLNHTLIFGGHYAASAEQKMDVLLAEP
ncbi:Fructosamine/Ketosamine-3-kinase [Crucibulum laeve]|uniref:protein-ribulosamine 3-kinase n=1 Tax=Crucibulum laeve TaxID=68775 RepID=A0A5C3LW50_9AGAR|nr:Fructosamine/Ketosamine-3-kinase [Crucibulum laeve]